MRSLPQSSTDSLALARLKFIALYLVRTMRTFALTVVFGIRFLLGQLTDPLSGPRMLRRYLENCGAAFVKLGQVLAMRYDLLPAVYCQELSRLLDKLPVSRTDEIITTIECDLGKQISELFSSFDAAPLNSASVAQVHAATLPTGESVAVKVKHPGVANRFRVDLLNLKLGARLLVFLGLFKRIDVAALLHEFTRLAEEELDFHHEARNIYILHQLMNKDDIDHYSPTVYVHLCGPSVIVMERLEGIWMHELLAAVQAQNYELLERWSAENITPRRISRLLLRSVLEQCFTHRVFHADPHAGNLIVMKEGTLGYVDFGMVGWLDEKLWTQQFALNRSLAVEKVNGAYQALLDMLEPLPDINLTYFEIETKTLLVEWLLASKVPGTPISERSSASLFLRLFDLMRVKGLNMSAMSLRLCRALMISDIISLQLCPELDRLKELQVYFDEQAQRAFEKACAEELSANVTQAMLANLIETVRSLPELVGRLRNKASEMGRRYERRLTGFEKGAQLSLRYFQILTLLCVALILSGRWVAIPFFSQSYLARFVVWIGDSWWLVVVAGILLMRMFGQIAKSLR